MKQPKRPIKDSNQLDDKAPNRRQWWYISLLTTGSVLLLASAALAFSKTMPAWEQHLFHTINGVHTPGWLAGEIAKPLSNAAWGVVGLVVLAMLIPRLRWRAWQYTATLGSAYAATFVVEQAINRPRPAGLLHDVVLRAQQGGAGFPSGHVATVSAFALAMWFFVGWPWRIVLALVVAAEAWARIFLGVHAPLDVIGGLGVGMAVVGGIHLLPVRLRRALRLE